MFLGEMRPALLLVTAVLFGAADYSKGDSAAASLAASRSKSHSPEGDKASSFTVHASAGEHSQEAQGDFVAKADAFVAYNSRDGHFWTICRYSSRFVSPGHVL